ncbi:lysophospholipid acyltransferase family protein [Temperatibacter marinus]|uniref:Lysophospholipid acyltransferase family protein n=1 Tax=Temperatibacter marinus TaxID=1456591 RepID=A0AA52HBU9_9PROT|nr:lysophospholipid acyltransferase family protein [Temperatibacter marinus]WND04130.1 lysophospholipid acyltransferase family protein [Temperatibacter marinus]
MSILNVIRSIIFNIVFYCFALIWIPGLGIFCFVANEKWARKGVAGFCNGSKIIARIFMGIRYEYRGLDKLPSEGAIIMLSKHQSNFDPILAFKGRRDLTALAKKELFFPFMRTIFRKMSVIKVDRQSRKAHEAMPEAGKKVAESNLALVVYPEATRVPVGEKRKLKSGAYYLQKDLDIPVYPISTNAGVFWGKGFWHKSGTAIYQVGDPFPTGLTKEAFMKLANEKIIKESEALMIEGGVSPETFKNS